MLESKVMDDNEVSKLVENYLDKTSLDDPTDELNELRPAIGKLTAAFSASKLPHERQKLVVAAISVLANHLRVNNVQADVLIECQKQLANLNDQRPSDLFTSSRKASRQHVHQDEEKYCVILHLCELYPDEEKEIILDGAKVMNITRTQMKTAIKNRRSKHGKGDAYSNRSSVRLYARAEDIVQNSPYKRLSKIYK